MALGAPVVKVEVMPAAAWVDVSDLLDLPAGVDIRPACPPTPWDDVEAGSCTFAVDDPTGTMWPGNPASPYYGQIRKGMPVRVTVTIGTNTSVRHVGRVRLIQPTLTGTVGVGSRVQFTSTDVLADLQGRTTRDRLSEELAAYARTATFGNGSDAWDEWPLTGQVTDPNLPSSRDGSTNAGKVVAARSNAGAVSFNTVDGASADGPLTLPAMATFEPAGAVGPVLQFPVTATTSGQFYLAFRTTLTAQRTVAAAYDKSGAMVWQLQIQTDGTLTLNNGQGVIPGNWGTQVVDGAWHTVVGYLPGAAAPGAGQSMQVFLDGAFLGLTFDTSSVRWLVVGGLMSPRLPGKQSECFSGDVTMIGTLGAAQIGSLEHLCATITRDPVTQFASLNTYAGSLVAGPSATTWRTAMQVANGPTQDTNLLELMRTVARTCGARLVVIPGTFPQQITMYLPEQPVPTTTSSFTVTVGQDDAEGLAFLWGADQSPTRFQVTGPAASATYIGDESEARQDDSTATWNISPSDARIIASAFVNTHPRGLRVNQVSVNLSGAGTGQALADGMLTMKPMVTRFTLAGVPSAPVGFTQTDVIACAWTERYTHQTAVFTVDTTPATTRGVYGPGTGSVMAAAAGAMTVTGGTCVGSTSTGTVIVTTSTGPTLTTTSARYPATLDWNGEQITVTAPGGATSPQTLTVTARGVNGTVARSHAAGEAVNAAQPLTFGL